MLYRLRNMIQVPYNILFGGSQLLHHSALSKKRVSEVRPRKCLMYYIAVEENILRGDNKLLYFRGYHSEVAIWNILRLEILFLVNGFVYISSASLRFRNHSTAFCVFLRFHDCYRANSVERFRDRQTDNTVSVGYGKVSS